MKNVYIKVIIVLLLCTMTGTALIGCALHSSISDGTPIPTSTPTPVPTVEPYEFTSQYLVEPKVIIDMAKAAVVNGSQEAPTLDTFDTSKVAFILNRVYISQLCTNSKLRRLFTDIYTSILTSQEKYVMPQDININQKDFRAYYTAITADCPELFHLDNKYKMYSYEGASRIESIEFQYTMSPEKLKDALIETYAILDTWKNKTDGKSAFEIELYVYDKIIDSCVYNKDCDYHDSPYGTLILGEALCEGYSNTFTFAMHYFGIPCTQICGNATNTKTEEQEPHAWNIVQIDGEWYITDPTWDDYDTGNTKMQGPSYSYMNITSEESYRSRSIESDYKDNFLIPECTSTTYNYHNFYNKFISEKMTIKDKFIEFLGESIDGEKTSATLLLKIATESQYNELMKNCSDWINDFNKNREDYYISGLTYSYDNKVYVLRFEFTIKTIPGN